MRTRHNESKRSLLVGALAGAAVTLLLAPAPGRETRAHVVHEVEQVATTTREIGQRVAHKCREALRGVADTLDRIAHR